MFGDHLWYCAQSINQFGPSIYSQFVRYWMVFTYQKQTQKFIYVHLFLYIDFWKENLRKKRINVNYEYYEL